MSKIATFFKDKTVFISGATGFLGQPLVEKILWVMPDVRKIYVLIRPKRQFGGRVLTAQERLERELYQSSAFDRLQTFHDSRFNAFLQEKLIAVAGDISQENLGLEEETRRRLCEEVDIVINSAAVVSFDAPLDEALSLNVFGARRVAEFARHCKNPVLVHVSTAYVCGAAKGSVPEQLAGINGEEAFPLRRIANPEQEIAQIQAICARVREEAASPEVARSFSRALVKRSRRSAGRGNTRHRDRFDSLRRKWLSSRLAQEGMALARERGWNDTYTYTKAIGEQVVVRAAAGIPVAILRPSVIESSLSEPSPGWLDGLRMADPLIVAIGKGRLRSLPLNPNVPLDLVPADMVVNALLAAIPRARELGEGVRVYQVATTSTNAISLGDLYDLIYEYFQKNPMLSREGDPIRIKPLRFPNRATFRIQHRLKSVPLNTAEKTLERFSRFDATQKVRRRISATKAAHDKLYYYGEIYEPYLNLDCQFEVDNSLRLFRSLEPEEQRLFNFDVTRLNWRHYIQNVHIPGVKKFILKIEGTGTLEVDEDGKPEACGFSTIPELLARAVQLHPAKTALQMKRDGHWIRYDYQTVGRRVREIAQQLLEYGLTKGDRVVLFSENRPEWGIAYLAASTIGVVVVPLDFQTWHCEVWSVAHFTRARAILLSERCLSRLPAPALLENEQSDTPLLLFNTDGFCEPVGREDLPRSTRPVKLVPSDEIRWPEVSPADPASIIFTTGTAVDPKGAIHSHHNFLTNLLGVNHYLAVTPGEQFLSVLPLYHALEFSCGFLMAIYGGACITYANTLKPKVLLETMRETGTTCMLGVPTLFALIREDIERRILRSSKSSFKTNLMETSKQLSRSVERRFGRNIGHRLFARVHEEFGSRIRVFVSGGSALGEELYRDFKAMGMPVYEGYGLTETAPVLTVSPLHRSRQGSAGRPLPGVELRLYHPDQQGVGEIIVRTPSLMQGYYNNPQATEKAIKHGWFHTGDLGWVDADGYVYITGRTKDVIVTGAGKNVYPTDLESIYSSIPAIREICVVGIKSGLTEDVHAVIVPEQSAPGGLSAEQHKKALQREIQELARELPSYQRLQGTHLVYEPLPRTPEGGLDRHKIHARVLEILGAPPETDPATSAARQSGEAALMTELSRLSGEPAAEISAETHLYTDLGLDSLMAVELLLFIEQQFKMDVPDDIVVNLQTVGDVIDEIRRHTTLGRSLRGDSALPASQKTAVVERSFRERTLTAATFTLMRWLFRVYFRLSVRNPERIPRSGAYLVAANHSSHLDTGAVIAAMTMALGVSQAQKLHVIGARDYFFNSPLKAWFFSKCLNVVPIERDEISLAGLKRVRRILANGEPVLIFPEGTRTRSGALQDFKPGIGLVAREMGLPILPVYIKGTFKAWPPGATFPRPERIGVAFGQTLEMRDYDETRSDMPNDELYRKISQDVRTAVARLSEESAGAP